MKKPTDYKGLISDKVFEMLPNSTSQPTLAFIEKCHELCTSRIRGKTRELPEIKQLVRLINFLIEQKINFKNISTICCVDETGLGTYLKNNNYEREIPGKPSIFVLKIKQTPIKKENDYNNTDKEKIHLSQTSSDLQLSSFEKALEHEFERIDKQYLELSNKIKSLEGLDQRLQIVEKQSITISQQVSSKKELVKQKILEASPKTQSFYVSPDMLAFLEAFVSTYSGRKYVILTNAIIDYIYQKATPEFIAELEKDYLINK